jgi:hypothetical protein
VIVTVDDEHVGAVADVAARLRECGMDVDEVLEATGQITGSIAEEQESTLRVLDGVMAVDRDATTFQLPPPDSDLQ